MAHIDVSVMNWPKPLRTVLRAIDLTNLKRFICKKKEYVVKKISSIQNIILQQREHIKACIKSSIDYQMTKFYQKLEKRPNTAKTSRKRTKSQVCGASNCFVSTFVKSFIRIILFLHPDGFWWEHGLIIKLKTEKIFWSSYKYNVKRKQPFCWVLIYANSQHHIK